MPTCKEDRAAEDSRLFACFEEHPEVELEFMMHEGHVMGMLLPDDEQVDINSIIIKKRRTRK